MYEKVLIVGRNSNLWQNVRSLVSFEYDEVSSVEVKGFICNGEYDLAIVFSYGPTEKENAELLSSLSVLTKNIVYISSQSVLYAEAGYRYKYPKIKFFCEQYLKYKALFDEVTVLRLGLVMETYSLKRIEGKYAITVPDRLAEWLNEFVVIGSSEIAVVSYVSYDFSSRFSERLHRAYKAVQKPNLISFIMTRIFDYALRKYGISWYGYSERFEK